VFQPGNPYTDSMKNNAYDEFIDAVLSLPSDVRGDILRIAGRESDNPYLYLFNRIQKKDVLDPIYGLLIENGLLTNEMFQH